MKTELTNQDLNFILESLNYSKLRFEDYNYPTQDLKIQRLNEIETVISKVKELLKETH